MSKEVSVNKRRTKLTRSKSNFVYVPILKAKAGERWALLNLLDESKSRVRPVIEFHDHSKKDADEHLRSTCDDLADAWGSAPFFLDCFWLHGESGQAGILNRTFVAAREFGLSGIPVVRTSFSDSSLARIGEIVEEDKLGCLIRATPSQLAHANIDALLEAMNLAPSEVDLLLDYQGHAMNLEKDLPTIPHLTQWREVVAASGKAPKSVADYELGKWHFVDRWDWISWRAGIASGLNRDPIFGDYVTRPPGAPAGGGNPPVHLRYAYDDFWAVRVDGRHQAGDAEEMHKICASVLEQPFFCGSEFSAGDMEITRTADPGERPGGPQQWLQWGISHHIELAVGQLVGVAA